MSVNQRMPLRNLERVLSVVDKDPSSARMLMMGVAYRSEVDDTRHSAAEIFYKKARSMGVFIALHDPHVQCWTECNIRINTELPKPDGYDIIVFTVPHRYYQEINLKNGSAVQLQ